MAAKAAKVLAWRKPMVAGEREDPAHIPGPRSGYSMTMAGGNGYLFGGLQAGTAEPSNELFMVVSRAATRSCAMMLRS